MNKIGFLFIALTLGGINALAQGRVFKSIGVDFVFPNIKEYEYLDIDNQIISTNLAVTSRDGFLLKSFGIQSSYNYLLIPKLSIGPVLGLQKFIRPDQFMIKAGGIVHYFFKDVNNVHVFTQGGIDIPLDKAQFKNGVTYRVGLGFPVWRRSKFNLNANVIYEKHYLNMENSTSLFLDDIPRNLKIKSFTISVNIQF